MMMMNPTNNKGKNIMKVVDDPRDPIAVKRNNISKRNPPKNTAKKVRGKFDVI
jgi:hypothetical protein